MTKPSPSSLTREQGSKMLRYSAVKTALLALLFAVLSVSTAAAQTTILIVDQNRVMRDSEVGKHIKRQLESIGKSMEAEMKPQQAALKSDSERLFSELKSMSVDALKSRPDLQQRARAFEEKRNKAQLEAKYKQAELQRTEQKALIQVNQKLESILKALVAERNADVIIDRTIVIYGGERADVTDTVISRLNAQMKTVPVSRVRLPRTPAKPRK